MERRMSSMTQMEIAKIIGERKQVILPTGATEAHGPHMPTDTDTHQAEHIALKLAERIDAVVVPPVAYGISKTFEFFPGTISLSIPTYQTMVFEIGSALIKQGFRHLIILNGNRPNGTANDQIARHLVDELDKDFEFVVSAVSYWEPAAARLHALRKSVPGGMGHGCELETAFQLATRPNTCEDGGASRGEIRTGRLGPGRADQPDPHLYASAAAGCRSRRYFRRSDQSQRRSRKCLHRGGSGRTGGDFQKPARLLSRTTLSPRLLAPIAWIWPPTEVHRSQMRGMQ